jgi:hypothetical protein
MFLTEPEVNSWGRSKLRQAFIIVECASVSTSFALVVEITIHRSIADIRKLALYQGVQERSVPVMKGCSPNAAGGGHSTHAAARVEGAGVVPPAAPPERTAEDGVAVTLPSVLVLDGLPEVPPVEATLPVGLAEPAVVAVAVPPVDPVAEPPVVVAGVGGVDAVGVE